MKRRIRTLNEILQAGSLMSVAEAAQALALSVPMIYTMARDGRLPFIKVSDTGVRFDPSEILDYIDNNRRQRKVG